MYAYAFIAVFNIYIVLLAASNAAEHMAMRHLLVTFAVAPAICFGIKYLGYKKTSAMPDGWRYTPPVFLLYSLLVFSAVHSQDWTQFRLMGFLFFGMLGSYFLLFDILFDWLRIRRIPRPMP